ncbi:isocitrate/isopropylmalate dehydrogenase family protein [Candidatus Micrarchaeota archaeon]|nr:isocitrate/isopropylmalate dehydrogenase family protein [Candidatus Micrarchaeota archaeon]
MTPKKKVMFINGDGVGPELMAHARKVVDALVEVEWIEGEAGYETYKKHGTALPNETVNKAKECDAILFCAVTTPPNIENYKSAIIGLRKALDLYANLRPFVSLPNVDLPFPKLNFVIVRENTEGMYSGIEEATADRATSLRVITRKGSERIVRFAFDEAKAKGFKKVTLVHKANVLRKSDGLFLEVGRNVASEYKEIVCEDALVDSVAMRLIKSPTDFEVIVTTNLFGDILSDEASALIGGLGVAPSANIGLKHALFEPVHGSAPKYAGMDVVNPTGMLRATAMMLEYLGHSAEAKQLENAIDATYEKGIKTKDVGGTAKTSEMIQNIIKELKK